MFRAALLLALCTAACSSDDNDSKTNGKGGETSQGGSSNVSGSGGVNATGGAGTGGTTAGGAGGASGSSGAAGSSAGAGGSGFFGASRCDQGDFLLCDGFEGSSIDAQTWTVEKRDPNVVELTSATPAARGSQSVHIRATNGFGYLKTTSIFPVPNNTYWGRMFLRVKRYSTVANAHWTVAEAAGTGTEAVIRVGGQYATGAQENHWGVGTDHGETGDWTRHDNDPEGDPVSPPLDTWTCLEWLHDGANNVTRMFIDGTEHPSLATTATDHGGGSGTYELPTFTSLWFGWWQYQSDPEPFDVWIDEVAADEERVGCTR